MKLARGAISRALDRPDPNVRFYLFHGSDDGQSRSHAQRLLASLGSTRMAVSGAAIKADAALLADEAGAMSLFGESRLIWVEPAGDEIATAVEGLMELPAAESPVVAIAGALRKTSALLKIAEASPLAISYVSYVPEGPDAERMVAELGRTFGLRIAAPLAARIAAACSNDQAVVRQELEKLAIYLDAAPETPRELDSETVDAVGADLPDGNFQKIADFALQGRIRDVSEELAAMLAGGGDAIQIVRQLQRRLLTLAPARARVEAGEKLDGVMASIDKSLFYKDKPIFRALLSQWTARDLSTLLERSGRLERDMMLLGFPPLETLGEELTAIARAAQRR